MHLLQERLKRLWNGELGDEEKKMYGKMVGICVVANNANQ